MSAQARPERCQLYAPASPGRFRLARGRLVGNWGVGGVALRIERASSPEKGRVMC